MEEVVRTLRINATADTTQAEQSLSKLRDTLSGLGGRQGSASKAARQHSSALKTLSNMAKHAQKHTNFLFDTLKRVVMYRALRAAIKAIVNGFKEGLENAYYFSKGINGDLAAALDNLAVKSQTMKNQLGAAFGGLLQTIMPIIQTIISYVTALASAITALFSMFGGRGTYLKAVDASAEFAKNTKSGAGSAKKMKDYLMGIDELNVIKDPNSGGGGGGSAAPDYASMFEVAELPDWMKGVQDLMNADMFKSAGARIADYFNSIVANWDADGWGRKLGEKIENGIELAWGFLYGKTTTGTGFSFEQVGSKLQEALNGIMDEIDPEMLGGILTGKINAILGLVRGFFANYDPKATGKWLSDLLMGAINSIEWGTAGDTVHTAITKIINSITEFVKTADWEQIGKDIADFVRNLKLTDILDAFTDLAVALCGAIHDILKGLLDEAWQKIVNWWNETAYEDGKFSMSKLMEGIDEAMKNVNSWVDTHIRLPLANALNALFGIDSVTAEQMRKLGLALPGDMLMGLNSYSFLDNGLKIGENVTNDVESDVKTQQTNLEQIGKDIIGSVAHGSLMLSNNPFMNPFKGVGAIISAFVKNDSDSQEAKEGFEKTGEGVFSKIWDGIKKAFDQHRKENGKIDWKSLLTPLSLWDSVNKDSGNGEQQETLEIEIDVSGIVASAAEAGMKSKEAFNEAFYANDNGFFGDLETEFGEMKKNLEKDAPELGGNIEVALTDAVENIWDFVGTATDGIQKYCEDMLDNIYKKYYDTTNNISLHTFSKKQEIVGYVTDGTDSITTSVNDMLTTLGENIDSTITTANKNISTFIDNIAQKVTTAMNNLNTLVTKSKDHASDSMNDAYNTFVALLNQIMSDVSTASDKCKEYVLKVTNTFKAEMMDCAGIARQEVGAVRSALAQLNGYTVHTYIYVHTIETGGGGGVGVNSKRAAKTVPMAHGGIIRAADGLQLPNRGQLFIAREQGAELIGNIGNGQTAVMNNNQIVSSVSSGVRDALLDAMAMQNTSTSDDRPIIVELDGREIARATRSGTKANGYLLASNPTFA